ncbi:MAG TPA: flavodoxin-dependent (E)-4-hydroxy-3-methylbut-2-enyl-diphosphate synthase, partial [Dysgonamonadaceae bacterium]|nr:flavodoxin-dependent (E)-4-hydroxy-3-methylbut-2-enyl-diphosphate synthase [Dysgonamonadaceae bacterium]
MINYFNYNRRPTIDVQIGNIILGSNHPIAVQSMTSTDTLDTESTVAQCERIIKAGGQLVRLT